MYSRLPEIVFEVVDPESTLSSGLGQCEGAANGWRMSHVSKATEFVGVMVTYVEDLMVAASHRVAIALFNTTTALGTTKCAGLMIKSCPCDTAQRMETMCCEVGPVSWRHHRNLVWEILHASK